MTGTHLLHDFLAAVLLLPGGTGAASAPCACAHDLHLTHTRIEVHGVRATATVRIFHDDLQTVLARFSGRTAVTVDRNTPQDSLFGEYFRRQVRIRARSGDLISRVTASGPDTTAVDAPMWWYKVEFTASAPITWLGLRYEVMYDLFDDQRNILTLIRTASGYRSSMYFAASDRREQSVSLDGGSR